MNHSFFEMAGNILKVLYKASYETAMMEVWMEIDKIQELLNGDQRDLDEKVLLNCLVRCKTHIEKNLTKRSKVYICSRNIYEFQDTIKSLEWEGYDVIARGDDEDTIERIYSTLPDIIVIDNDGNNNGITIFNAIKEEEPIAIIPVVFTGIKNDSAKIEALLLGALDYINKPFVPLELFIKLKNFMVVTRNSLRNSIYDITTKVYSRSYGEELARKQFEFARKNHSKFSALIIDMDKMAEINIRLGKSKGNDVIRDTVLIFKEYITNTSFIYRYSGDKFVIVILDLDINEILSLSDKAKKNIRYLSTKYGMNISFTGGLAVLNNSTKSYGELLALSEESLNKGKHSQRGEVYTHSVSIGEKLRKNMLIIDEDPIILSILAARYINKGYRVLTSRNAFEALGMFDGNRIDIVITDLIVPGITGNEIIKKIKDKSRAVKILILSSQRGEEYIDSALKAGADEYVVKPFSPVELDLRIQRLIG